MKAAEQRSEATIDHMWREFCLKCFANISHEQYIDLRRTFYGGASALFFLMMRYLDSGDEVTEHDMAMMHNLKDEIYSFNEDVKAGKA